MRAVGALNCWGSKMLTWRGGGWLLAVCGVGDRGVERERKGRQWIEIRKKDW